VLDVIYYGFKKTSTPLYLYFSAAVKYCSTKCAGSIFQKTHLHMVRFTTINAKSPPPQLLVASRIKEQDWTNDFSKHPLPVLYSIDIDTNKQTKISNPSKGYGDYAPQFVPTIQKLVWLRGYSIIDTKGNLWKDNSDGTEATEWLLDVEEIVFYK